MLLLFTQPLTLTGAASVDLICGILASPSVIGGQAGAVDGPTISTGAYRKKKRKALLGIEAEPAAAESATPVVAAPVAPRMDFQALAQATGKTLEALRAEVDSEIAELFAQEAEEDDEEALSLILALIED